ncbi:MAG: hypothetical protein JSW54_12205 [Fidelibacterota bacterium]|nr:MAG: hypothetical protein JSW54_12205 [Candidatus Neomarinimicrobiota bacterium]
MKRPDSCAPFRWSSSLIFLLLLTSLAGQESRARRPSHHIGYEIGLELASLREDLLVPLGFHGPGLSVGVRYSLDAGQLRFNLPLRLKLDYVRNRYSHDGVALSLDLMPSLTVEFFKSPDLGHFGAGLCFPLEMNNIFLFSWDDAHLYWLSTQSLGIAFDWRKKLRADREAYVQIQLPFSARVSRPPVYRHTKQEALDDLAFHFSKTHENIKWYGPDDYHSVFIRFQLTKANQNGLTMLGMEFEYDCFDLPKKVYTMDTAILLSKQWRLAR